MKHIVINPDQANKPSVKSFCAERDAQVVISDLIEPGTVLIFDDEIFRFPPLPFDLGLT